MNAAFRDKTTAKTYWALVEKAPQNEQGSLTDYLKKNEKQNKSYVVKENQDGKLAKLHYKTIGKSDNYTLLEIELETGRHHQIRCQLANIGCIIKGDVKYGAKRANKDASISLHARYLKFNHPTSKEEITITAPLPDDALWNVFDKL
jgi:23S rRNA pseudouridine1911/1915/1917 synthase